MLTAEMLGKPCRKINANKGNKNKQTPHPVNNAGNDGKKLRQNGKRQFKIRGNKFGFNDIRCWLMSSTVKDTVTKL